MDRELKGFVMTIVINGALSLLLVLILIIWNCCKTKSKATRSLPGEKSKSECNIGLVDMFLLRKRGRKE